MLQGHGSGVLGGGVEALRRWRQEEGYNFLQEEGYNFLQEKALNSPQEEGYNFLQEEEYNYLQCWAWRGAG
eukprot:183664-Pleurochrysis_carterae.AAC.2